MLLLYNLLFPVVMLAYLPVFAWRQFRRGNFLPRCGERFGLYANAQRAALKRLRAPVWVHAVSVGEVVAALGFIRRWQERHPEQEFVLSTTTTTGQATAQAKLPERVRLIYCPFDFPLAVLSALRTIRPALLVIFEVEYWPNLISMAAARGTKVVLVNGRMSDRSGKGYRRHRWFFAPLFRKFTLFCMQGEEDAARLRAVLDDGAPVQVCNTMKFDQVPDVAVQDKSPVLDAAFGPGPRVVWTAGSTHPGEEDLVARIFLNLKAAHPELKLVLVPRHVERTAAVEEVLRKHGLRYRLLKPAAGTPAEAAPADVLLVNTTGELMGFYGAADITYVGKSLAGNTGGHNIIEPAIFGKPILHGAHMENFRMVADLFHQRRAAVEITDDTGLEPALRRLLDDPPARNDLGHRARGLVEEQRGAMDRTITALEPLLPAP